MSKISSEAIFLVQFGNAHDAFERKVVNIDEPIDNEVLIEVEAFGLNYADVMARIGLYRGAPPTPCVLGYEVVGKIVACGSAADQSKLGKRVLAFCRFGGYAKHVKTYDYATVCVENEPVGELLALATQGVTAFYMADYLSPIHKGDKVLIHSAAGGVGTLLIQLAKRKGAYVIAKVGKDEKFSLVRSLGADLVVNHNKSDYSEHIKKELQGNKLDVIYNPVSGSTFKKDLSLLGEGGRLVLFGASELSCGKWGIFSKLNFIRKMGFILPIGLMVRSRSILGVNMLKIADARPEILEHCLNSKVELYKNGEIKPQVGKMYTVDDLAVAHIALSNGETVGKIGITW